LELLSLLEQLERFSTAGQSEESEMSDQSQKTNPVGTVSYSPCRMLLAFSSRSRSFGDRFDPLRLI